MGRLALNKNTLNQEKEKLGTYTRFLPVLEMKRKQLLVEQQVSARAVQALERTAASIRAWVAEQLPMLAAEKLKLEGLVQLQDYGVGTENVVGVEVPRLETVSIKVSDYGRFTTPHWVDDLVDCWRRCVHTELQLRVARERKRLIDQAVLTTTQRINLFSKVLLPQAEANIRRIQIGLDDASRAAVIRSKLTKARHPA